MRTCLVLLLTLGASLAAPTPAKACSCARPGVDVSPGPSHSAPTNARVHLTLPPGMDEGSFALVKRVTRHKEVDVPVAVQTYASADHKGVIVVPQAELDPDSDYEIVIKRDGKVTVLGVFATGKGKDDAAPSLEGIKKAGYFHPPAVCCTCTTGDPYLVIDLGKVSDDLTPESGLSFAVWASATGGAIDYSKPPAVIVRAWNGRLVLGHPSTCMPANFDFPSGAKRLRLGIKAMDLAGNGSAPAEITVDLSKPSRRPPPRR